MSRRPAFGLRREQVGVLLRAARTFRPALHGQAGALMAALMLALSATAVELLKPWPIKWLFDRVLIVDGATGRLWGLSQPAQAAALAGVVAALAAVGGILTTSATIVTAKIGRKVATRIRRQVFEHLHRLGMPFHTQARSGDLLIRLMGDVNLLRDGLVTSWLALAERGALFLGMSIVLIVIDPLLALAALLPLPLLALGLTRSSRALRRATRKQRRNEGDAAAFAMESLRQIRIVKTFGREADAAERFAEQTGDGERAGVKAARVAARMGRLTEIMSGIGMAAVLFVGARRVLSGDMTPGDLIVATTYARLLFRPLRRISREGGRLAKASSGAERLLEVLQERPEPSGIGRTVTALAGAIRLRNVTSSYPGRGIALSRLSFDLLPGTFAVVDGESGSGKSTLLSLLLRLVVPDDGEIDIDGRPIGSYELNAYRRCFAYVPQDLALFSGTIRDNVLYGRPDASDEDVERAARQALIHGTITGMPDGYDTVLGEGGQTLSGGQARRIMLARAAVSRASILLLDEPLAGLDPRARSIVAAAVRRSAAGRTTIVVNHGPSDEFDPDVRITLSAGRVSAVHRRENDREPSADMSGDAAITTSTRPS